ncbi:MAG: hypothetical protein N2560_00700 [Ignavibacteria bacterium]|nr:hypothetical protein [Ignavibacteria bacterium]
MKQLLCFLIFAYFIFTNHIMLSQDDVSEDTLKGLVKKFVFGSPFKQYEYFNLRTKKFPSISLFTGLNQPLHPDISSNLKFNTQNFASIHIGSSNIKTKELKDGRKINFLKREALFVGNYSSKWIVKDNQNINATMWRFGVNFSDNGYGYKLGEKNYLFFTHGNSLIWSKFDVDNSQKVSISDSSILGRFSEQFRFGNSFQSGISLVLLRSVSFDFRFERSVVYPAHKFWYWLGSYTIEGISLLLLDEFIREINYSSPYAAPIVNVILKSALSYGIYELRKDRMNWPFKTESPLFHDNFKIGITFMF